jgi:hypothetical protein
VSCGGGTALRERKIAAAPQNGGKACPSLKGNRTCHSVPCDNDCHVSDWGMWGHCSRTCGGGIRQRYRIVLDPAKDEGKACPTLMHGEECGTDACAMDCKVSAWDNWSRCTKSCGGGVQARGRIVGMPSAFGGIVCPVLKQMQPCGNASCPVNCEVSIWGKLSKCSATCGGGQITKTRMITTAQQFGGKPCPTTNMSFGCNSNPCAVDCAVTAWKAWGGCTQTCGGGQQGRHRAALIYSQFGGRKCPSLMDGRPCNTNVCPVKCHTSAWTQCSRSCGGGGERHRTRNYVYKAPGITCPNTTSVTDREVCGVDKCPRDCNLTAWSSFSNCTKECGNGKQSRSRRIVRTSEFGGVRCPQTSNVRSCNTRACRIDCEVTNWFPWTPCSKTCNQGSHHRIRQLIVDSSPLGKPCPPLKEVRACAVRACGCPKVVVHGWDTGGTGKFLFVQLSNYSDGAPVYVRAGENSSDYLYFSNTTVPLFDETAYELSNFAAWSGWLVS